MSEDRPWEGDWLCVTRPLQPRLDELLPLLAEALDRSWLTNQGPLLQRLEVELATRLGVPELAAVTSGTVGLELALKALVAQGEVITTAYSFPATWCLLLDNPRFQPVFVDIDDSFCVDPAEVEAAISPRTRAVLAVHAYGTPCDHGRLDALCRAHGLQLIYDAAPAFGVRLDGRGIGTLGDLSVFSFHATKVFTTLEGGAVTGRAEALAEVRLLRNFGLGPEGVPIRVGQNGKMDELRAAYGLVALGHLDAALARRAEVEAWYLEQLSALGIDELDLVVRRLRRPEVVTNHAYFPVLVRPGGRVDRDGLWEHLRGLGVLARRYFDAPVPRCALYDGRYPPGSLPRTDSLSRRVLCLPLHHRMTEADCVRVRDGIAEAFGR